MCQDMHPGILSKEPDSVPRHFTADELQRRFESYRERLVYARLPPHIAAFKTRADPKASDKERSAANTMITALLSYFRTHWRNYVDTIITITKRRSYGFPKSFLCYGCKTRWNKVFGLRTGPDGRDHQYCNVFSHITPEMQRALQLPTIANAWKNVRKSYDPQDVSNFQQREEARKLPCRGSRICSRGIKSRSTDRDRSFDYFLLSLVVGYK